MEWQEWLIWLSWLYAIANMALALYSFNAFTLLLLAIWHRRHPAPPEPWPAEDWPSVLVQLPLFNERYVVERLIDAAAAFDYPRQRLIIQVLDDSTDDTSSLAQARVEYHRQRGLNIQYLHRTGRAGYKAGALQAGLAAAPGEFVAIFDADFVPPADFLRRMMPTFQDRPRLGILQARWEHLNPDQNLITRVISLAFDLHFGVDQTARSRSGLFLNFNGSAGILRRAAIEAAGGWHTNTLAEDTDLSYRMQITGWQVDYRPDIAVPAELPSTILAFKVQQFRWAKGSTQAMLKLAGPLFASKATRVQKIAGFMHLTGYSASFLVLISLLLSLPVVLLYGQAPLNWAVLGLAAFVPPLLVVWSQVYLGRDRLHRWTYYPGLFLVGIGLAVTNSAALLQAYLRIHTPFVRTPKFSVTDQKHSLYALPVDSATWLELCLAVYAFATGLLALERALFLAPFIFLYAAGLGFTAGLSILHSGGWQPASRPLFPRLGLDKVKPASQK